MKKFTLAALLLFSVWGMHAQNLIYSTIFPSGGEPSGWSQEILGFEADNDFYFGDSYMPGAGNFSAPAAIINDDISFDDTTNVRLISPAFDTSGYETIFLSFEYSLSKTGDNLGTFQVEVYTGTAWQQVLFVNTHTPPVNSGDIDVTAYKNANFKVRFTYNDQFSSSTWGAGITNFLVEGTYDVVPNDLIANAFALTCDQTIVGTTVTATAETGLPACNNVDGNTIGVWYKFSDPGFQSTVTASLCGSGTDFDSRLSVFKGPLTALTCVTANDNSCGNLSSVTFAYDGYSDYYLLVSGAAETTGNFTIAATCTPIPPANDEIANAYDVDTFTQPYTDHAVQFTYATAESQSFDYEVNGCDGGQLPYVWYKFTAAANGTALATLTTPSPGGLNLIHFYSAPNESATVPQIDWVNQASNACNVFDDSRQIDITAGTTYYVAITLEGGNSDVVITLTYDCDTPAGPVATAQSHCEGATVANLTATCVEGSTINWFATEGGEPLASTTELTSGTYYVTQTIGICESEAIEVIVTINAVPDAPTGIATQTFTAGETIADLEVTTVEGATLTWYVENDIDGYTVIPATTVLENGVTYYVTQSVNGCESDYFGIAASQTTGTGSFAFNSLKVYPNPANSVINIANNTAISQITVTNLLGQTVLKQTASENNVQVNISALAAGTYILQLQAENATATIKVIKQ
ncbi:T9SS type A sorting domain-containing protein [Flavobacterium zepuense]|uniref:T9SS type A sorting domain-containing protein n=1 Tax=Flavobacterium zepuense TaxID=2593302 RepID=A0A552UV80_9FLAO|nr:T9SS type A sorting domain-containing protein [Flavobacterium zepuense]TRW22122.1 T9SS type A sorting domain-containing protein [Flavobacterium zepuense]